MRIRTIKPEFWKHATMAQLPAEAQLLALALLNMADDHGYFEADPRIVRGEVMPFRDDLRTIERDLMTLVRAGWVEIRTPAGHSAVGKVTKFREHQRVEKPKASKLGLYFDASAASPTVSPPVTDTSPTRPVRVADESPEEVEVEQGSGREAEEEEPPPKSVGLVAFHIEPPDRDTIESWTVQEFWRAFELTRREAGYPPEKWPSANSLRDWWQEARGAYDVRVLGMAAENYYRDPHWKQARPACPWAGFAKQWTRFLPRKAVAS